MNVLWIQVCNIISQIRGIDFPLDKDICLTGNYTSSNLQHNHAIKLTEMLLTTAKKCIALKWKTDIDVPSGLWISEVCNHWRRSHILCKERVNYLKRFGIHF